MWKWFADWKNKVSAFNRNVKLFMLANVLISIGMGVFMVMYNLYIKELGMPETINGKVISMTALASAIMLIPAGFLSDKFGRKWMIVGGAVFGAMTLFYRSITVLETPIIYAAFLTGIFMAFVQVSGVPFLAENTKPKERVHMFSIAFCFNDGCECHWKFIWRSIIRCSSSHLIAWCSGINPLGFTNRCDYFHDWAYPVIQTAK